MLGLVVLVIWVALLWRPLWAKPPEEFPDEEPQPGALMRGIAAIGLMPRFLQIKEFVQPLVTAFKEMGIRNIVKIGFSFFQILGSFPSTFTVKWPPMVESVFTQSNSVVFLDVMGMLGIGCFVSGMDYSGRLSVYTVGGLIVIAAIMLPGYLVGFYTWIQGKGWGTHEKYNQMQDVAWWALTLWFFVSYPTLSIRVLETFNCDERLELMIADFNEKCPVHPEEIAKYLFLYAAAFAGVYPFGIPCFLLFILYQYRVPRMAQDKINTALLDAMIIRFKKMTSTKESEVISKIIGNMTDPLFEKRVQLLFERIDTEGAGEINMVTFVQALKDMGLNKVTEKTMRQLHKRFGPRGDKTLLPNDLLELIKDMAGTRLLFHGMEHLEDLTTVQLKALCGHNWGKAVIGLQDAEEEDEQKIFIRTKTGRIIQKKSKPAKKIAEEAEVGDAGEIKGGSSSARGGGAETVGKSKADEDDVEDGEDVDNASDEEMRIWIMEMANDLLREDLIVMPFIYWDGSSERERQAIARVGSLFMAYKVSFWYFELFEMGRKLMMTSVMGFLLHGSAGQIAIGFLVLWASMQFTLQTQPYALSALNGMQIYALVAQCLTLFYGLMVVGDPLELNVDRTFLPVLILIVDGSVLLYPLWHWTRGSGWVKNLKHQRRALQRMIVLPSWLRIPGLGRLASMFGPDSAGMSRDRSVNKGAASDDEHDKALAGLRFTSVIEETTNTGGGYIVKAGAHGELQVPSRYRNHNALMPSTVEDGSTRVPGTKVPFNVTVSSAIANLPAKMSRSQGTPVSSEVAAVPYLTAQLTMARFSHTEAIGDSNSDDDEDDSYDGLIMGRALPDRYARDSDSSSDIQEGVPVRRGPFTVGAVQGNARSHASSSASLEDVRVAKGALGLPKKALQQRQEALLFLQSEPTPQAAPLNTSSHIPFLGSVGDSPKAQGVIPFIAHHDVVGETLSDGAVASRMPTAVLVRGGGDNRPAPLVSSARKSVAESGQFGVASSATVGFLAPEALTGSSSSEVTAQNTAPVRSGAEESSSLGTDNPVAAGPLPDHAQQSAPLQRAPRDNDPASVLAFLGKDEVQPHGISVVGSALPFINDSTREGSGSEGRGGGVGFLNVEPERSSGARHDRANLSFLLEEADGSLVSRADGHGSARSGNKRPSRDVKGSTAADAMKRGGGKRKKDWYNS
jgi:hypothetical protein